MEEKKEKKKLNKKLLLICLAIALVFAIVGFIDIKSNAAESSKVVNIVQYVQQSNGDVTSRVYNTFEFNNAKNFQLFWYSPYDTFATGRYDCQLWYVGEEHSPFPDADTAFQFNGKTYYVIPLSSFSSNFSGDAGYFIAECADMKIAKLSQFYDTNAFIQNYLNGVIKPEVDYTTFVESDDLPIVQNLEFDRIEISENKTVNTVRTVTDYLRFEPNNDYKLMIMVCPSVYSTFGSDSFVGKFKSFEYSSWVFMCVSDFNLKEISCDLGTFEVPTYDMSDIVSSDYYSYYNEILKTFNGNTDSVFKPTMGYRLAYVDEENGLIGPSTYIKPFSYDHLNPTFESYSYFTLYTDGTRNTEKIMNLKTWTSVYDASNGDGYYEDLKEEIKDTIVNVQDVLKDYTIVDNDVDVQEATNWLYSVVDFIKGTPSVIGSVLGFLPQPILYGMYVCVFLGVIASGVAIFKALI